MDEFQKKDRRSEIDLTEFDLTDFKEYFEEEDAQREAEAKEKAEREAAEEAARLAEEERIRLEEQRQKEEEERKAAEELAARKKAEFEIREKEEARVAAEKAAAAVLAAKKAEEAKAQEQKEISARLLEQADVNNEMPLEQPKVESVAEEAKKIEFAAFSSILDIEQPTEQTPSAEESDEAEETKVPKKGAAVTVICIILAIATVVCSTLAVLNFINKNNSQESGAPADTDSLGFYPYGDLAVNYNDTAYPNEINESLKAMYSENKDLAGWLTINGTAIDFPVMQDSNNKHYLYNNNAFDENARYGTPFIDFRCSKTDLSKNTVIYGHKMNNSSHFGSLESYTDTEFYKNHPVIFYDTLTDSYAFKVYAVFYSTTQAEDDGGYVFDYYNPAMSDESFSGYIELLNQYALYTTGAGLEKTDKIITLSTCTHVYDSLKNGGVDARLVVVGRLLRDGEANEFDADAVTVNEDYRRPQLWYDKNGKTNPYSSHRSWKPSK